MKKAFENKKLVKPLLIAMIAVLIILGGTYAWLRIGLGANNTNIIKAGALDLRIDETPTEGAEVRLERAIPQSYREGLTNKPYRFTLINNSTIDTDYTISLEDLYEGADASLTTNDKIADNLIRYILVKNDDEMIATNSKLLSTGRTIDAGTIAGKVGNNPTEIPYTLYIWIDSKAGDNNTQADIMSKIFNARLGITAEQHHGSSYVNNRKGDVILFNPVTLEYCNSTSETNCYEWVILNKIGEDKVDLMYLNEADGLSLTSDAFTVLFDYTKGWNEALIVDDSYNIPALTSPIIYGGFEFEKARLPKNAEITQEIASVLSENNLANLAQETPKAMITSYDNSYFGMYGFNNSDVYNIQTAQYANANYFVNGTTYYYVHPVIRVGNKKTNSNSGKLPAPDSGIVYKAGDLVYFDPVSENKCDSETFDLDSIKSNNSTCYKWRVITTDDTKAKQKVTIQLDHSIGKTSWAHGRTTIDSSGVDVYIPTEVLGMVFGMTSSWTRIPLLNFSYDTSGASTKYSRNTDYGELNCLGGKCRFRRNGSTYNFMSGARTRIITAEEIAAITNTVAKPDAFSQTWNISKPPFYFSKNSISVGEEYGKISPDTSNPSTELGWLVENTSNDSSSGATKSVYSTETEYEYWTLTPEADVGNSTLVVNAMGFMYGGGMGSGDGARPVATISKTLITK